MDPLVYINVNTQTSFSTDDNECEYDDCQESDEDERPQISSTSTHLETIEERLHDDDENEEEQQQQQPVESSTEEPQQYYENYKPTTTTPAAANQDDEAIPTSSNDNQVKQQQYQLNVLRDLLRIERQKNQQRKLNNNSMQQYLGQLQADYLCLQRELVETLELGHKIKAQKEAQISALDETLKEKNRLIEQLRDNLANLDESKIRSEFRELMEKQNKLFQLEKEQLKQQIENAEQQLMRERINNSQILQQFQTKLEEQMKAHENETAILKKNLSSLEADYEKLLNVPANLTIKNLKEEKSRMSCQLGELSLVLNESQNKYETLGKRIEGLLSEQEQIEAKNQEEMERLQQHCMDQRRANNEMKLMLEDRDEIVQIVQFNLQRSEKRVKNLLIALKGKEETYNELISQVNTKHEQELDKITGEMRSMERRLIDCQGELDRRQNEIMKLELERENQLESIRNDRDERLIKLQQEKSKLEKELKMIELKFAHEFEIKEHGSKMVEHLQKELQYFKEESKRLSLQLIKAEAKLASKQKELNGLNESLARLSKSLKRVKEWNGTARPAIVGGRSPAPAVRCSLTNKVHQQLV